jgi:hypothetical protein
MTLAELKADIQAKFHQKFDETLMYDEEPTTIDILINTAVRKCLTKYEKFESIEISASQYLTRALSIIKCVPSASAANSNYNSVWYSMKLPNSPTRVNYYFTPSDKHFKLVPEGESVWIEYVVDPAAMTVLDLTGQYYEWVVDYALALLNIKEGMIGTTSKVTALPFEFNYETMANNGTQSKKDLEDDLNDMYMGTLAIRTNR